MSTEAEAAAPAAKPFVSADKYPVNDIDSFATGAIIGLAARFATNVIAADVAGKFLEAACDLDPELAKDPVKAGKAVAAFALAAGEEIVRLGEEKGLVGAIPMFDGSLAPDVMDHTKWLAIYNSEQNVQGQYYMMTMAAKHDPRLAAVMRAAEDEARKAQGLTPEGLVIGRPGVHVNRK